MEDESTINKITLDSILHNIKIYKNKKLTEIEFKEFGKIANEIGNLRSKYNKEHEKEQSSDEQYEIMISLVGV
jgi:hypothetical protein